MLRPGVVEAVPQWAVPRGEIEVAVRAVLDAEHTGTVGITAAVHGAGGFGKSTVAQWVCADRRVRRRFGNRRYWVTVGWSQRSREQIASKVAEATMLITGEPALPDPLAAGAHLGSLLEEAGRPVLLVLDDVWDAAQLAPFLLGAPQCVRLVTTRNTGALPDDAVRVLVDRLEPAQAAAVLTDGLPGLPEEWVERLVAACGSWALMLRLANRWIAEQTAVEDDPASHAADLLNRLSSGPHAVDRPGAVVDVEDRASRNSLVEASMQASLGLLTAGTARRFLQLGAFPAADPIPIRVLMRLWGSDGLDAAGVRRTCADMQRLALVQVDASDGGAVILHDVLHAYARAALGFNGVREVSRHLVEATEPRARSAWWSLNPETDGYLLDHVIEFLDACGEHDQATALAGDLRWVEARLRQRGPTAPIADLTRIGESERAADLTRIAHLLTPPGQELTDTLHSYLQPVPAWSAQAEELAGQPAGKARLLNAWPPPDRPDPALRRTLAGHGVDTLSLALSPDGSWLLTGGHEDETMRVWDTGLGIETHALNCGGPHAVAVAPDGTWAVTGSHYNGVVRIWDTATWTLRREVAGRDRRLSGVAISADGTSYATASYDGTVRVMEADTDVPIHVLTGLATGDRDEALAVAFSPDGTWLATGSAGMVQVWDRATWTVTHVLAEHRGTVRAMVVAPDGAWLAARADQTRIWDIPTWTLRSALPYLNSVDEMTVSPGGTWLATGSTDGSIRMWDLARVTPERALAKSTGVLDASLSPDGTWIATSEFSGTVRIIDTETGAVTHALDGCGSGPVAIFPDGARLITGGSDRMQIWDTATWSVLHTLTGDATALAVSPDCSRLVTGDASGILQVWDTAGAVAPQGFTLDTFIHSVTFSPDGAWLVAAGNGKLWIWDTAAWSLHRTLNIAEGGAVTMVAFSPDGTWIITAGYAGVHIVDTATWTRTRTWGREGSRIRAVAISPDGDWIATGAEDRRVQIWRASDGECVTGLTANGRPTAWMAWGPILIAGGEPGLYGYRFKPAE